MDLFWSAEFRLAYALILQAAALGGAWRFVSRRVATDSADRVTDVLLVSFLVQYLSVTLPGLAHVLSPLTIALVTLALSAALYFAPARATSLTTAETPPPPSSTLDRWTLWICTLLAVAYAVFCQLNQSISPVIANDAITYHFPAAVRWLQTGRLALFETWYFNPANTYSPLAGSTFIAWWIAPLGNDLLARSVQFPPLLLLFFVTVRLARAAGARTALAATIALALLMSRPFLRQSIVEKDDLYLTAFFACAAAGLARDRLRDPLGPWRIGVALGLFLATKYTALLALPAFLLAIDAPLCARWPLRRYAIALGAVLLLAGPWYLRNLLLTGNPIYPARVLHLPGLFATARSIDLSAGPRAVWTIFTARDQSLPLIPTIALLAGLLSALAIRCRALVTDPVLRLVLFAPPLLIAIFLIASPYPEVRFTYPAFVLLFVAAAAALSSVLRAAPAPVAVAGALVIACWATCWTGAAFTELATDLIVKAAAVTAVALPIVWFLHRFPARRRRALALLAALAVLALAAEIFVNWKASVDSNRNLTPIFYTQHYGPSARVWAYVRDNLPPREAIAYANTFLVHPLSGFDDDRPLLYIPTRRGINHLHDLAPLPDTLPGERVVPTMAATLAQDPDDAGWLAKLLASPATHLVVFHHDVLATPPEAALIAAHPERFQRIVDCDTPTATLYRIVR